LTVSICFSTTLW